VVRRRPALHRLAHNLSMHARAFLPGVVKRLKDAADFSFIQLAIKFRKPQIKAYKQRTFHAVDCEVREPVARRETP